MALMLTADPELHCTQHRQFPVTLQWVPEKRYPAGSVVELRSASLRCLVTWRYVRSVCSHGDVLYRWTPHPSGTDAFANRQRVLMRVRLPYGLPRDESCFFYLTVIPGVYAGVNETFSVWIGDEHADGGASPEYDSTCEVPVTAGPVERLGVYSRPMPGEDGTVRTCVVPEDRFGNPAVFSEEVQARLLWEDKDAELPIQETVIVELQPAPRDVGRCRVYVPMKALSLTENINNGRQEMGELMVVGNPVWPRDKVAERALFGEIHWHTDISGDGARPLSRALRQTRDYTNLDFAAPSDHTPSEENWAKTVADVDAINQAGVFSTLYGFEQSSDRGHVNFYFLDPDHSLRPGRVPASRPEDYLDALEGDDFIAIPHHTGATAESFREDGSPYWHPFPWGAPRPFLRLAEIFQICGNFEREVARDVWRGWHQNNGGSLRVALEKGHRIGFTGGTDNHCGWPGRIGAKETEGLFGANHPLASSCLTGVWAAANEREKIFGGLQKRRTWAVSNCRALLWFTVNGTPMGGEGTVKQGEELTASFLLSSDDVLQSLEILVDGHTVFASSVDNLDIDLEVELGEMPEQPVFIYLRALQRNGGLIYGSPVFLDPVPA